MPKKKKSATKATPKAGKAEFGAKAAFVRSHPDLSAKEVVDLAAKAGLTMTVNHVYNVRSTSGISRPKGAVRSARRVDKASNGSLEATFRRMVLDVGVARARAMIDDIEAKLAAIVNGR